MHSLSFHYNAAPALLCSSIAKEHRGAVISADASIPVLSDEEEEELLNEIESHNENMQNTLDAYQDRVDEMRKDLKRKQDEKNKELRLKTKLSRK